MKISLGCWSFLLILGASLAACADNSGGDDDAGSQVDAAVVADAASADAASADAAALDATVPDASSRDAIAIEDASSDAGAADATALDAAPLDAAASDAAPADATPADAASPDSGPPDSGMADAGLCVSAVFNDYFVKHDGTVWHYNGTLSENVVVDDTGLPLASVTHLVQNQSVACARIADGSVWCWVGVNGTGVPLYGLLGNGDPMGGVVNPYRATRVQVAPVNNVTTYLTDVTSLQHESGSFYATPICALRLDQTLWCWGVETDGHLIQNNNMVSAYAKQIEAATGSPLTSVDEISLAYREACVRAGGSVSCWGSNIRGGLAQGDTTLRMYPTAVTTAPMNVTKVVSGNDAHCVLAGGLVYCWGDVNHGQLGVGPQSNLWTICNSNYCVQTPSPVMTAANVNLTDVADIYMEYFATCAIKTDTSAWCWGSHNGGDELYAVPLSFGGTAVTGVAQLTSYSTNAFDIATYWLTTSGRYFRAGTDVTAEVCR